LGLKLHGRPVTQAERKETEVKSTSPKRVSWKNKQDYYC